MKGFTLVELIIVVAVIGVLAAFIIGNLFDKREHTFMVECVQHKPHFECEYMWKQMHPDPVVVYAPLNH